MLSDRSIALVNAVELVVVDVFYVDPLELEDTHPFSFFPPVSEGLTKVNVRDHLSNSHVLVAVYDCEKEVDRSRLTILFLACCVHILKSVVVTRRARPYSILHGFVKVVVIRTPEDEKLCVFDAVNSKARIVDVSQTLELLFYQRLIFIVVELNHGLGELLLRAVAGCRLHRRQAGIVHRHHTKVLLDGIHHHLVHLVDASEHAVRKAVHAHAHIVHRVVTWCRNGLGLRTIVFLYIFKVHSLELFLSLSSDSVGEYK